MRPFILATVLCLATARLDAQAVDLQPGVRLRVRPSSGDGQVKGTLLSRTADSLVVATPQGVQYRFATRSIETVEVSFGKSGSAGAIKGFKWGAGISVPLAILAASGSRDYVRRNSYTGTVDTLKAASPLLVALFAAAAYGGTGALIGAAVGAEEWRTVSIVSPSISVAADRLRLGVAVHLR